jgi:hypothetical protein
MKLKHSTSHSTKHSRSDFPLKSEVEAILPRVFELGFYLIPVDPKCQHDADVKSPARIGGKQWGPKSPTRDLDLLRSFVDKGGGLAVVAGKVEAQIDGKPVWLVIFDVEASGQQAWLDLQKQFGQFPETFTQRTPHGGWHFFFYSPVEITITDGNILREKFGAKGVEIKAHHANAGCAPRYPIEKDLPVAMLPPGWVCLFQHLQYEAGEKGPPGVETFTPLPPHHEMVKAWNDNEDVVEVALKCSYIRDSESLLTHPDGASTTGNVVVMPNTHHKDLGGTHRLYHFGSNDMVQKTSDAFDLIRIRHCGGDWDKAACLTANTLLKKPSLTPEHRQVCLSLLDKLAPSMNGAAPGSNGELPRCSGDLPRGSGKGSGGQAAAQQGEWLEPKPLTDYGNEAIAFPIDALAVVPAFREMCQAVADYVQVPVDLPALMGLSVLSVPLAAKVKVEIIRGTYQPLMLWALVVLPPGERKSAVVNLIADPVRQFEELERERQKEMVYRAKVERQHKTKQLQAIEKELNDKVKAGETTGSTDLLEKAAKLRADLEQPEPTMPRLLVDDTTPAGLADFLERYGSRAACLTDEAAFLEVAMGRFDEAQYEIYVRGHDGGDYRMDRRGEHREIYLTSIHLTLGLCIQDDCLQKLANDSVAAGRGFFPRFLAGVPQSLMGSRKFNPDADIAEAKEKWNQLVFGLFGKYPHDAISRAFDNQPRLLTHSEEGKAIIRQVVDHYEPKLKENHELSPIRAWVSKAVPGQYLRLAGVLHCATGDESNVVRVDCLRAAVPLLEYFLAQQRRIFNVTAEEVILKRAQRILKDITLNGRKSFSKQYYKRTFVGGNREDEKIMQETHAMLIECGYIRAVFNGGQVVSYQVNPKILNS